MRSEFDNTANRAASFSSQGLTGPQETAQLSVELALGHKDPDKGVVLMMGEHHEIFSHHVTQILALRKLTEQQQNPILCMEYPHNRLHTILVDRGYDTGTAQKLADHIQSQDGNGHITAKAILGGNAHSLRGGNFHSFTSRIILQAAIHHDVPIKYVDAARIYPDDFLIDYSDPSTNEAALKSKARRDLDGRVGPDDTLIRNTHMVDAINAVMAENKGATAFVPVGGAHTVGMAYTDENGVHPYQASMDALLRRSEQPTVIMNLDETHRLPEDYQPPDMPSSHVIQEPGVPVFINDMSHEQVRSYLAENGLDPDIYDPAGFENTYRAEFNQILEDAEATLQLNIAEPGLH